MQAGWLPAGSWSTDTVETDTHYRPARPCPRSWLSILATHCAVQIINVSHWEGEYGRHSSPLPHHLSLPDGHKVHLQKRGETLPSLKVPDPGPALGRHRRKAPGWGCPGERGVCLQGSSPALPAPCLQQSPQRLPPPYLGVLPSILPFPPARSHLRDACGPPHAPHSASTVMSALLVSAARPPD